MPPRQRPYDPIVEVPHAGGLPEPTPIRGMIVEQPGAYLHVDDVTAALRSYAHELRASGEEGSAGAVEDAAEWLASGVSPMGEVTAEPAPLAAVAADPEVERIELFPDPSGKWFARTVSPANRILAVSEGSYDKGFVEQSARNIWPGVAIYELQDEGADSTRPSDRNQFFGPSPRLWQQN